MEKREVIVYTDEVLTAKDRKEYKKTHPGKRLCFSLRYPDFYYWLSWVALAISIISLIVKIAIA